MKILSIDTSTSAGGIVLCEDDQVLAEINTHSEITHSARLLAGVDYVLKSTGTGLPSLDAIAAVCGPGSFTGLRIGIATVKALSQTLSRPVLSVTAFEAWVEKFSACNGVVAPMIDARRGEVYLNLFKRNGAKVEEIGPAAVDQPVRLLRRISYPKVLFIGDGAVKYRELILQVNGDWQVQGSDCFLGRATARLAFRLALEQRFTDAASLAAYYLRKSDAELNWKGA
ncbi:MAG: tRNA (adenosine(37)-N6)-threonylcarbamoyltransferase complex dimerization subunit type 1 TsaB [Acidobacteriota bacterium]